jgi:hypothetical protein
VYGSFPFYSQLELYISVYLYLSLASSTTETSDIFLSLTIKRNMVTETKENNVSVHFYPKSSASRT